MRLAIETAIDPSVLSTPEATASVFMAFFGRKTLHPPRPCIKPTSPRPTTCWKASNLGNWTDTGSDGIEGGVSRRLAKGDVVIIPGGVPHGWASLEADITYLIVRSDPDKKLPLK